MADLEVRRAKALARQRRYDARFAKETAEVPGHFAHGVNFYKLCWVFFICCFLGVVIETIFCFIASGRLSQRTGLVWGPFNLIYGFGAVLLTVSLQRLRGKTTDIFLWAALSLAVLSNISAAGFRRLLPAL